MENITKEQLETLVLILSLEEFVAEGHENFEHLNHSSLYFLVTT